MARSYGGRGRFPSAGQLLSIALLAVIALWGVWFGVQSVIALWWPLNLAYGVAGLSVALLSVSIAWALRNG